MDNKLLEKIVEKKEFSKLPKKDVELVFAKFDQPRNQDFQKLKLTRSFLRKIYSSFSSRKLLTLRERDPEWVLGKHKSTKERLPYYGEVYTRILKNLNKEISVIDLGSGANGFSYGYFKKIGFKIKYIGVEAVGQLVDLTNLYFKKEKLNAVAKHFSLFELDKIKSLLKKIKKPRVIFLFKVIDSLEVLERDYSKKLISGIASNAERIIVSFATQSLGKHSKFKVNRNWLVSFIGENFRILDNFNLGAERYIVFENK